MDAPTAIMLLQLLFQIGWFAGNHHEQIFHFIRHPIASFHGERPSTTTVSVTPLILTPIYPPMLPTFTTPALTIPPTVAQENEPCLKPPIEN
jgi:hypothetical protein